MNKHCIYKWDPNGQYIDFVNWFNINSLPSFPSLKTQPNANVSIRKIIRTRSAYNSSIRSHSRCHNLRVQQPMQGTNFGAWNWFQESFHTNKKSRSFPLREKGKFKEKKGNYIETLRLS